MFDSLQPRGHQTSLSFTVPRSLLKPMSIESVMPSDRLVLRRPLLLSPSVFPIRVFSNESVCPTRWSKYWSFSFSISPSNDYLGFPGGSDRRESTCRAGDQSSIPGLGRPPSIATHSRSRGYPLRENGYPLQYSCLEIPQTEEPGGPQSQSWTRLSG